MSYYKYKYSEVLELKYNDYNFLVENMVRAKAKDRLKDLQIQIYPHAKKDNQDKIHRALVRESTPPEEMKKKAVKVEDLKGIFGGKIEDIIKGKNG
jgi:predicted HAD superfamily phosphohydrolase YqeG